MKNSFPSGVPLELKGESIGRFFQIPNECYQLQFKRNYEILKTNFQKKIKQDLNFEFLRLIAGEIRSAFKNCFSGQASSYTILNFYESEESLEKLEDFQNKAIYYFLSLLAIYEIENKKSHFHYVK